MFYANVVCTRKHPVVIFISKFTVRSEVIFIVEIKFQWATAWTYE